MAKKKEIEIEEEKVTAKNLEDAPISEETVYAMQLASAKAKLADGVGLTDLTLMEQVALIREEKAGESAGG